MSDHIRPGFAVGLVLAAGALSGCADSDDLASLVAGTDVRSGEFQNGVWEGSSSVDDLGATGEVVLEISNGDIVQVKFQVRQPDGSLKDENYGTLGGQVAVWDLYNKAQHAVAAQKIYATQLEEVDDLAQVDLVTGASVTFKSFIQAVSDALAQARKS